MRWCWNWEKVDSKMIEDILTEILYICMYVCYDTIHKLLTLTLWCTLFFGMIGDDDNWLKSSYCVVTYLLGLGQVGRAGCLLGSWYFFFHLVFFGWNFGLEFGVGGESYLCIGWLMIGVWQIMQCCRTHFLRNS